LNASTSTIKLEGKKKLERCKKEEIKFTYSLLLLSSKSKSPSDAIISSLSSIRVFPISMNLSMDGEPPMQVSLGQFL
jgi:hypothetical protein